MKNNIDIELEAAFGEVFLRQEPMSKHTTMGVGGPAEYYIQASSVSDFQLAIKIAHKFNVPYFIVGRGSNIIVGDHGIKGLVIQNNIHTLENLDNYRSHNIEVNVSPRHQLVNEAEAETKFGSSWNNDSVPVYLRVGSGWKLMVLILKLIEMGYTGLEWFYGIAGSVAGGVYMNVHGASYFLSDFIEEVEVLDRQGNLHILTPDQLEFSYDDSIFHRQKYIITNIILKLYKGDVHKALEIIDQWGKVKIIKQPQRSSGCMFQNIPVKIQNELNLPTPSMGYVIDKVLQLGGTKIGGAMISHRHCAFIENTGDAKAYDVKALVDLIKEKTQEKFGFEPKLEVEFVGEW